MTPNAVSLILFLVVVAAGPAHAGVVPRESAEPPTSAGQSATLRARLSEYVESLARSEHFSGVVRISRGDHLLWTGAFGEACREWHTPNTVASAFHIGSISKQFTAVAILMLSDAGRLSVGDTLGRWFPEAPSSWHPITVHQLLTHTSGIPDLVRIPEFAELATRPTTLDRTIRLLQSKPLEHAPGAESRYGNSGYLIAARIVELVSGMPFDRFLDEHIYRPLVMTQSGYASSERVVPNEAHGYVRKDGEWRHTEYLDMTIPVGAGAEYSSAPDLDLYLTALHGGRLLSAKALAAMCADHGDHYGYGWEITRVHDRRAIQHVGDINGYGAHVAYFPEGGERIIVLCNTQGIAVRAASDSLAAILFGSGVR